MTDLEEAWQWYTEAKSLLGVMARLGDRYWDNLPWDDQELGLGKDEKFKSLEGPSLSVSAEFGLKSLDDIAIVVLFSAFEAEVRTRVLVPVEAEGKGLRHPALRFAAEEAIRGIQRGSFHNVLESLKRIDPDLAEQVRQIRRYRNWVCHGKRGAPPQYRPAPGAAHERLAAFLKLLERDPMELDSR